MISIDESWCADRFVLMLGGVKSCLKVLTSRGFDPLWTQKFIQFHSFFRVNSIFELNFSLYIFSFVNSSLLFLKVDACLPLPNFFPIFVINISKFHIFSWWSWKVLCCSFSGILFPRACYWQTSCTCSALPELEFFLPSLLEMFMQISQDRLRPSPCLHLTVSHGCPLTSVCLFSIRPVLFSAVKFWLDRSVVPVVCSPRFGEREDDLFGWKQPTWLGQFVCFHLNCFFIGLLLQQPQSVWLWDRSRRLSIEFKLVFFLVFWSRSFCSFSLPFMQVQFCVLLCVEVFCALKLNYNPVS